MTDQIEDMEAHIEEMVELRNRAATAYYKGETLILTDPEFDALLMELKAAGIDEIPGHGYVPDEDEEDEDGIALPKVVHEYKMQSLKKVHEFDDINKWVKGMPKGAEFLIQPKYDGFALDIVYNEEGELIQAATRGDHTKGEDVTNAVRTMAKLGRIPETIDANGFEGNTHVRGEAYIDFTDFVSLNELSEANGGRTYASKRNTAPGLIRRGNADYLKFVSFVAYDTNNYEDDEIDSVEAFGFLTPKGHHYVTASTAKEIHDSVNELGIKRFSDFEFETDGAVIKLKADHAEREEIGSTSTAPRWAVAYKYPELPVATTIREVVWNHNRTGKITPVANFDKVKLTGDALTGRATLANYGKFQMFGFRPGDPILVIRANGVIPFIVGLDSERPRSTEEPFEAPAFHPTEDFPTRLSPTGKDLLAHPDAPEPLAAVVENSVKVLELKGIGSSFIEEMIDLGRVTHFLDMLTLTHDEIVELRAIELKDGERSRSADVAVTAIKQAFDQPLWRWIAAIGMKFIATSKSPILETRYKSLDELAEAKLTDLYTLDKFSGDVHAKTVVASSETIKYWADRLRDEHGFEPKPEAREIVESTGSIDYNGKTVVVTGSFPTMGRKDVEQWVKDHGGKISSGVTSKTDILLYGEKAGTKLAKAQAIGTVQLITGEKFEEEL